MAKELRSARIKNALKHYLLPVFNGYQFCALRCLWSEENKVVEDEIWGRRRKLESLLAQDKSIASFISCVTFLSMKSKQKKRKRSNQDDENDADDEDDETQSETKLRPGIAVWIVFRAPSLTVEKFEQHISCLLLHAGVDLVECSAIRSRGLYTTILLFCICN